MTAYELLDLALRVEYFSAVIFGAMLICALAGIYKVIKAVC